MRIAFIGQKGIPASFGGVERHVEELATEMAALGHDVTVFVRSSYTDQGTGWFRGVRTVQLPTVGTKHLDAILHSVLSALWCIGRGFDVVHFQAVGPSLVSPIARLRRGKTICTIHAEDWRQQKWGAFAKFVLKLGAATALRAADRTIVVSPVLREAYRASGFDVDYIPNGVRVMTEYDDSVLQRLGILKANYGLFVGRLIPDKGVHELASAWRDSGIDAPLVVVGEGALTDDYAASLRRDFSDVCVFAGWVYGPPLASLLRACGLFVLPSHVEGMPLVLLEAFSQGARVLASDIPENVQTIGAAGCYYPVGDVDSLTASLVDNWDSRGDCVGDDATRAGILDEHDWHKVAVATIGVYESALSGARRKSRARRTL